MRDAARTILERAPLLPRGVLFAVGVGAAFGLGVVVAGGVGTARGNTPSAPTDILAKADERARVLDEKRVKLTYADELKKADPVETEVLPDHKKHAPVVAEAAAAPLEPAPPPVVEAAPAPVAKPAAKDADDDDAPAEKGDDTRIEQALAKVLAEHQERAAVVVAPPAQKSFALQVAASPTKSLAEAAARKIGGDARVVEGEVGGKPVFRVRVGRYPDRASAEQAKAKLTMPSFIVSE